MPNGKPHDHPLTDILVHGFRVFGRRIDRLIQEIVALGGQADIERSFDVFAPPPKRAFEQRLTALRDRLKSGERAEVNQPSKPRGRWLVTCSCGWTDRLPAHKMAEQAATLHQKEASRPALHTVTIAGDK